MTNLAAVLALAAAPSASPAVEPWERTHALVEAERDWTSWRLAGLQWTLRLRLLSERPDLEARLDPEPPAARERGWGILPALVADEPERAEPSSETTYAYPELRAWTSRVHARLDQLDGCLGTRDVELEALLEAWMLEQENFERIDSHVGYHAFWQRAARTEATWFAARNALLRDHRAVESGARGDSAVEAARARLEAALSRCTPPPFLRLSGKPRARVLRLPLATDIGDEAFLRSFEAAVERTWNDSAAFRAERLRLAIDWRRVDPRELYPEGPPARGNDIDLEAHRARFRTDELVLTTGADSTHADMNAIFLGPQDVKPRVLAHELGHLLGFEDAYLRAYEGSLQAAAGVRFVEIVPGGESLMTHPATGRVTPAMARALVEALQAR